MARFRVLYFDGRSPGADLETFLNANVLSTEVVRSILLTAHIAQPVAPTGTQMLRATITLETPPSGTGVTIGATV